MLYGYVYFFYKNGKVERLSVALDPEDCRHNKSYSKAIRALQIFSGLCHTITAFLCIGRAPRMIFWIFRGLRVGL